MFRQLRIAARMRAWIARGTLFGSSNLSPRLTRPGMALVTIAALGLIGHLPNAIEPAKFQPQAAAQEPNKVSEFMRAKLNHSQRVLEGLTTEDFDVIAKHAQELSLLSQATTWQVLQTAEYRERSTEFRRSADALSEAARKKNLEGAALAYVDVTMKCVNCHKYVRHVRMAKAPPLADQLAPRVVKKN